MHHLTHEEKLAQYTNIYRALKPHGRYIEGDYIVDTQAEEDRFFAEKEKLRTGQTGQSINNGEIFHLDTPCTIDNQIKLFSAAGFANAKKVWRKGNTVIIVGEKAAATNCHL